MVYRLFSDCENQMLLYQYLLEVDNDFGVPLSEKICLLTYADKLLSQGCVLAYKSKNDLLGIVGFYCNDNNTHVAHLTILSVKAAARGRGVAKKLIQEMIEVCRQASMSTIICDSVNPIAITLYESLGFIRYNEEYVGDLLKVYLKKEI